MTEKRESSPESIVREIKRQTRRKFTAEEKIWIVFEGLSLKNQRAIPKPSDDVQSL